MADAINLLYDVVVTTERFSDESGHLFSAMARTSEKMTIGELITTLRGLDTLENDVNITVNASRYPVALPSTL